MITKIILILIFLSIISAFLIHKIAKKNPEKESPWKKYITYNLLLIVNIGLILAGMNFYFIFAILILIIGLKEIFKVGIEGQLEFKKLFFSIGFYSFIIISFLFFLNLKTTSEILFFYFTVIIFDAFSQLSGQLFGKTKITSISPNKTYEGLFGGFIITILSQLFVLNFDFSFENKMMIINGILVCIFAFFGDLLASFYKRQVGVKDFSNLLPGQGGILDRYDSWIFAGVILAWI